MIEKDRPNESNKYFWKRDEKTGFYYRQMPSYSFAHQFAIAFDRPVEVPKELQSDPVTVEKTTVFRLIGWGETKQKAERMAKGKV